METIENGPQQNRLQAGRHPLVTILTVAFIVALFIGGVILGRSTADKPAPAPAPTKVVKTIAEQDCTKVTNKVGALCASVTQEHGVTVTRTYVTLKYDAPADKFYNYLQGTTVQLNYADDATIANLCTAAAVATTNSDRPYTYEYATIKKEYCDPAQQAKDAGNFTKCASILDSLAYAAPAAFTWTNVDDACAVPAQPKGTSALVDTGKFVNDTP